LNATVEVLKTVLAEHGSRSVLNLSYAGNTGLLTWYLPSRIWNVLGAVGPDNSLCSQAGHEALSLHYGSSYGIQPEEIVDKKAVIFWGFNAAISSPHVWNLSLQARKKGAKIATIDSRVNETTLKSDLFLCPRPGSDVALVHGVAREMIRSGLIDQEFIDNKTSGFSEYPAITLPNSKAFKRGLQRDDVFSVVHDTHWTETVRLADVALPAPVYLEKDDIVIPWSHRSILR